MEKFWELYKKFSNIFVAGATAYWLLVGLVGDILGVIFVTVHLGFLLRIIYILVGAVGVLKLIEIFKPELIQKAQKKPHTPKK